MSKEQKLNYNQYLKTRKNQVEELELNARYWKALYEIKYFTLLSSDAKLNEEYNAFQEKSKEEVTHPSSTEEASKEVENEQR